MLGKAADGHLVNFSYSTPEFHLARRLFIRAVEKCSGQPRLRSLYQRYVQGASTADFFETAVEYLELNVNYDAIRLARVPASGPVVFIANHPYGVLDGIVLTWLARKARPDVKVLANKVLCQVPAAAGNLLPVDFAGTPAALRTNLESRAQAQRILDAGGAVGIFPAGGVGASERPLRGPALDPAWHPFAAKLIRRSNATVVPIYFAGQNSRMFQIASHVSYTWRLSLFFFETARRIGSSLDVGISEPIPFADLEHGNGREGLLSDLRRRTYALALETSLRKHGKASRLPTHDREYQYPNRFGFR